MQSTRGSLLVSTRVGGSGKKILVVILCLFLVFFGFFFIANEKIAYEMARDLFGNVFMGNFLKIAIPICIFLFVAYSLWIMFRGSKSYVEVYEQAVVGITKINPKRPTDTMQNFEIGYDEIINVSETNKGIQIYTSYTVFEVAAMKNRGQAVQEIRSRMKGKQ